MGNHEKNGCEGEALTCQPLLFASANSQRGQGQSDRLNIEAGRRLFSGPCTFITAAVDPSKIPLYNLPEVAFVGRSNVGKSSLINALTSRRALARVSVKPGCTQAILFFRVSYRLMIVDLPGYGYAAASKSMVKHWTGLVCHYLCSRQLLRSILFLIDSRHGIKDNDRMMMQLLDKAGVGYQLVISKADKVGREQIAARQIAMSAEAACHPAAYPGVLVTSAEKQIGIPGLRAKLEELVLSV